MEKTLHLKNCEKNKKETTVKQIKKQLLKERKLMRLSVLGQAPITKGNTAADALKKAEELAILADELGYYRMWMAEHHGTDAFASSAPEITVAHLGAKTKNKIGRASGREIGE